MKNLVFILSLILIMPMLSCNSSKEVSQRRSLMMPKTSEVPRNKGKSRDLDYSKKTKHSAKKAKYRR